MSLYFLRLLLLAVLCLDISAHNYERKRPHIIFILADDMGWNDAGFHGSNQIPTPNMDAMAFSGTIIHNYYTQPICTPSRSALMTGRYPIHNGMQCGVIYAAEPWGLPLTEKLLPQYLMELGYVNRAVGKWHLGFFKEAYTPIRRGFHSHYGYWLGHKDYYTHLAGESEFRGYDFKRDLETNWTDFGKYSTDIFTEEAEEIIANHDTDSPLFLYIAHLATHAPLQAPSELVNSFKHIKEKKRRIFAGMLTKMDESIGRVVAALKKKGILDDSIIIFTSDNGGATNGYDGNVASNWPLKGCKDTLWEAGLRVPAIIWSPLLSSAPKVYEGLMSVSDWLPTLLNAANGTYDIQDEMKLDGNSQWDALRLRAPPPSDQLLHNINCPRSTYALRKGHWKIVNGNQYNGRFDGWFGKLETDQPYDIYAIKNSQVAEAVENTALPLPDKEDMLKIRSDVSLTCNGLTNQGTPCHSHTSPCLFNITNDPCETENLAEQYPEVLKELQRLIKTYKPVNINNKGRDPTARPAYWNYTWTHWKDFPMPNLISRDHLVS